MTIYPLILLLIVAGQDKPKPDTPEDRARRAAIVDRIMREPIIPKAPIEKRVEDPGGLDRARQQAVEKLQQKRAAARVAQARVQIQRFQVFDGDRRMLLTMEQPTPEPAWDGEVEVEQPPMAMRLNLNNAVLGPENFDRYIFGDGFDEEGRRIRLQTLLSQKIDRVMKEHDINPPQLQKLRLAGRGDIKRFLDRVEERRPEFEVARKNFNAGQTLLFELKPLSEEFQGGPFGADSFFAKTLKRIESEAKGTSKDDR